MFSNKCKLKVKRTTHRQIIALLVEHLSTRDDSIINQKDMKFFQLTGFFHQNFVDPV